MTGQAMRISPDVVCRLHCLTHINFLISNRRVLCVQVATPQFFLKMTTKYEKYEFHNRIDMVSGIVWNVSGELQ